MTKPILATTLLATLICFLTACVLGGAPNREPPPADASADAASAGSAASPVPDETSASSDDAALDMSEPWEPPIPLVDAHQPPDSRSPEEMTLLSGAIARVRMLDVEELALHPGLNGNAYSIQMVFKFRVLEWLKGGSGEETILGGVGLDAHGDTLEEARWKAAYFFDNRDAQFDDKESILMFQDVPLGEDNTYSIGCLCFGNAGSPWARWLPMESSSEVDDSSEGQSFIWRTWFNPYSIFDAAGQSDESIMESAISLNILRRLSALSDEALEKRTRSLMGYMAVNESAPEEMDINYFAAISDTWGADNWITLVWENLGNPDSGIEGYRILRRKQSDANFIELANFPIDSLTYEDAPYQDRRNIQPETKYIYRLQAYGANGDIADARVAITTVAALEPLDAPTATPTANLINPIATPSPTPAPVSSPTPTSVGITTPSPTPTAIPTPASSPSPTPIPSPAVIIRAIPFAAEIADTPDLRTKGLGSRDRLAPNSGMLFIFPSGQASSFWMRGMRFPLDFVWIGADCRVADITERVPHPEPGAPDATLPLINPAAPAAYVFEINAGEIERFGIEIGDPARFRNIRPDAANSPATAYPCDCRETEDCE